MLGGVFPKTLRDQRRGLAWWTVGVVALAAFVVFVYPTVRDNPELNELVEDYPDFIKALIGASGAVDFTSPAGYLSNELLSFMGPVVMLVFAIGLGANAIAGEEDRGTLELLLANPISRRRLVAAKAAALVALVVAIGAVLWLALVVFGAVVDMDIGVLRLAEGVTSLGLLALHFGAFALLIGCLTGRRGVSMGIAAAAAVLAYVVSALALLVDWLEPYRKFSPYYHAIGVEPLRNGLGADHVAILAGAAAGMILLGVLGFERRDVRT
jgi:ABC-2 type transport system permease protein